MPTRIAVVGTTCAGKTTVAKRLAERRGVPHVELDALHWGPGWSEPSAEAFRERVQAALAGEAWVADGAYHGKLGELVLERAELVVWLDPPLPTVLRRLLDAGASDAWLTPIVMKKGRPAVTISVLVAPARRNAVSQVLFREAGTLGIRASVVEKQVLEREWIEVATRHGMVRVKIGRQRGQVVTVAPEFEDCAQAAREAGVPARDVYEEATRLAREAIAE